MVALGNGRNTSSHYPFKYLKLQMYWLLQDTSLLAFFYKGAGGVLPPPLNVDSTHALSRTCHWRSEYDSREISYVGLKNRRRCGDRQ